MIEILSKSDIAKIQDKKLKDFVTESIEGLSKDFNYPNDGYFVVVEDLDEIKSKPIELSTCSLDSLDNGLYADINMVEIKDGIVEILVFIDNDINVSFIMHEPLLDGVSKEKLQDYII